MVARAASAADQVVYSAWVRGLELALSGTGWVTGGTPSAQGTPDMTVALAAGSYRISGTTYSLAGQNVTITAAHATLTRTDLISVDSTGTATVTAGTAASAPGSGVSYADPPDLPSGHIPIALVEVAAGVTSILDARIVDIRSIIPLARDLIDAKGDLLAGTAADTISRLAVGANDTILMADSAEATGLRWQAPATTAEIADVAAAEAVGTSDTWPRGDHAHAHGSGYLPDAHHNRSHDHATAADGTTLTPATLNIPNAAAPAQTAEGQVVWDSDDDVLTVGDGTSRKTLVNTAGAQTLTDKTLTSPVINTQLTGTAVGTGASQVAQGDHTTPAATATTAGHVPTPPNNTTTFLRGDMTFAAPATFVRKTADETVNNSTTLQDDDTLLFAVGANESWTFEIWFGATSATTTPSMKLSMAGPVGAVINWSLNPQMYFDTAGNAQLTDQLDAGATVAIRMNTNIRTTKVVGVIVNGANAGNCKLQWAQNTATAEDTTIKAGAFLLAHKVA